MVNKCNPRAIKVKGGDEVLTDFVCGYIAGKSGEGVMIGWSERLLLQGFRVRFMVGVIFRVRLMVGVIFRVIVRVSNRVGFKLMISIRMYLFRTKWSDMHITVMFSTTSGIESSKV